MSHSLAAPTFPLVQALCRSWVERASELSYKGKKRDCAALDYICGAATLARETGNLPLCDHLARVTFIVSIRGHMAVVHIATMSPKVEG